MSFLSKNIIYLIILILSLSFLVIVLSQQRIYVCLDNLEKIKSKIEYAISYIDGYHSNIILRIEMPENFEYNIYSDGKDIYLYDFSCNAKLKINYNVTLLGEIYSKRFFYIIKNNTEIYLSPKELDIPAGIKEDFISIYSIQTSSQSTQPNIPKNQVQPQSQQTEDIFLIFIRSNKFGGHLINNYDLKFYAQISTEHLKNAFVGSFSDLYPFNLSNAYKYVVIEDKYIDTALEDCFNNINCQKAFSVFQSVCNNIKNAYAIIFVIMVNDASLLYGGVSLLSYAIKYYFNNLRHYSGCNAKIITFVQINAAFATPPTLTHEVGHAIGNLYDQYLNGCNSFYIIDLKENKIIDYIEFLEKNIGITCNRLEKNLGAEISNLISTKIDEIYSKYKISFIDKDYLKNEICFGKNALMLYKKDGLYIIMNLSRKPDSYEYSLSKDCNMILIDEKSGNVEYGDCYSIITNHNLVIDVYEDQILIVEKISPIGICIGNFDIFKKGRDMMYTYSPRYYFSSTSITAFKNNINKIWN